MDLTCNLDLLGHPDGPPVWSMSNQMLFPSCMSDMQAIGLQSHECSVFEKLPEILGTCGKSEKPPAPATHLVHHFFARLFQNFPLFSHAPLPPQPPPPQPWNGPLDRPPAAVSVSPASAHISPRLHSPFSPWLRAEFASLAAASQDTRQLFQACELSSLPGQEMQRVSWILLCHWRLN